MKRATLLLLLAALLSACPTIGGPLSSGVQPITASGPYVHGPSGFTFPESFGAFRRVAINQYDPSGANIGVGYNLEQADTQIALTLYVRPPARDSSGALLPLARQFEIERANILQYHPGTASPAWTPPPTVNREKAPGYAMTFRYEEMFSFRQQEVESLLFLFEHDGWVVKYRITYPSSQQPSANPAARDFVSSFPWRGGG